MGTFSCWNFLKAVAIIFIINFSVYILTKLDFLCVTHAFQLLIIVECYEFIRLKYKYM